MFKIKFFEKLHLFDIMKYALCSWVGNVSHLSETAVEKFHFKHFMTDFLNESTRLSSP